MFLMRFLALTHSIFNFFKRFSDVNSALNLQENDVYHKNKKIIFFLWSYGEFSDIKSSNSNPMDDFENFFLIAQFFLK